MVLSLGPLNQGPSRLYPLYAHPWDSSASRRTRYRCDQLHEPRVPLYGVTGTLEKVSGRSSHVCVRGSPVLGAQAGLARRLTGRRNPPNQGHQLNYQLAIPAVTTKSL
jgi:hypothetical protein